tara:strand:- start:555 stop:1607 length:1053 start_codon:yes stop_codon:yes gene_type:complete
MKYVIPTAALLLDLLLNLKVEAEPETDHSLPELEGIASEKIISDYTILEKSSEEDLNLLMQSLIAAPSQEFEFEEPVQIEPVKSNYPKVLYDMRIYVNKNDMTIKPLYNIRGSCVFLNSKGFFLSVYHAVKSFVEERKEGNNSNLMLIYDPVNGYAFSARPLIFSKEADIVLGRIDADIELPIETVKIAENNESVTDVVYSQFYNKVEHSISNRILKSGGVLHINSDRTVTYININTLRLIEDLEPTITLGEFRKNPFQDGNYRAFMESVPGSSGGGVFDSITHYLVGMHLGKSYVKDFKDNPHIVKLLYEALNVDLESLESVGDYSITSFTGAEAIRNMLTKYISSPLE